MSKFLGTGSPVTCLNGCVASSQFLASEIGINILKAGGNAADAAVAMAAALGVIEPFSTGLGGDAFCLFYDASQKKVKAMNASGRSPAKLTHELMTGLGFNEKTGYPINHGLAVTVPGTALGWIDSLERFGSGKFKLKELLQPAIDLARKGFPVAGPVTSQKWSHSSGFLFDRRNLHGCDLLQKIPDHEAKFRAPFHGEIFKNPKLATVMEQLAEKGKEGFYDGWLAESIIESVQAFGGVMEKNDLKEAEATFEEPISIDYKGITVWEASPNSQGIVVLIALNILKNIDLTIYQPDSPEYWHIIIEVLKLAFADGVAYCADPSQVSVPISELLKAEYGKRRAKLIDMDCAMEFPKKGLPMNHGSDTVYFSVIDSERNACSFINSIYVEFGSGIVPRDSGFCLQNRGSNFSLDQDHPNVVAPRKRTYHTLIPGMVTDSGTGELLMCFGVMGGFMQPQGHIQVLLNCVLFGMNPQQALDFPRVRIAIDGGATRVQDDMPASVITYLKAKGHSIEVVKPSSSRFEFGVGQAIATSQFWNKESGACNDAVLFGGSDRRHDGIAIGY